MSTAAMRSTTVCPRIRRKTPIAMPSEMRTAATIRMISAKRLLQVSFEWTGDQRGCFVRVSCLHIETMDEQAVAIDVDHERSRRKSNRIRERQPSDRGFELGLDPDNPGIDLDARRIDVAHH